MHVRENVFEHLTLCLASSRNTINGSIKTGHCYREKKAGLELDRTDFKSKRYYFYSFIS